MRRLWTLLNRLLLRRERWVCHACRDSKWRSLPFRDRGLWHCHDCRALLNRVAAR